MFVFLLGGMPPKRRPEPNVRKRPAAAVVDGKSHSEQGLAGAVADGKADSEQESPDEETSDQRDAGGIPPPFEDLADTTARRSHLRKHLDIPVSMDNNFDKKTMKAMYDRRRFHMIGAQDLEKWAIAHSCYLELEMLAAAENPLKAFAFWHCGKPKLVSDGILLPDQAFKGLESAAKDGRLDVTLLTYHKKVLVPAGVNLRDAGDFAPRDVFDALCTKRTLQIASDFARASACKVQSAVFLDCDCIILQDLRPCVIWSKPFYGHMFSSMEAHKGHFRNDAKRVKQALFHYLKTPGDFLYLVSPLFFSQARVRC